MGPGNANCTLKGGAVCITVAEKSGLLVSTEISSLSACGSNASDLVICSKYTGALVFKITGIVVGSGTLLELDSVVVNLLSSG
jgi:hypothetical protein